MAAGTACQIGPMGDDKPDNDGDGYHTGDFFVQATHWLYWWHL